MFDDSSRELVHFLADMGGNEATKHHFAEDALVFEKCLGLDSRFLHHHSHNHECASTCVKNVKQKSKEQLIKVLKEHRSPPCRSDVHHVVELEMHGKKLKIRRRGKEIVNSRHIRSSTARNQFGSIALDRLEPFRTPFSECLLASLRCNNDLRYICLL